MMSDEIKIMVELDEPVFRKFAIFDNLLRNGRWLLLAGFAAIMLGFAVICFVLRARSEGAVLLSCTLAAVGVALPSFYMWSFLRSIRSQVNNLNLKQSRYVYTLSLSPAPDGVQVYNGKEHAKYNWDSLYGAYRVSGCTYLYILSNRAFLLPDSQVEGGPERLWTLLASRLPSDKLHDKRLKKSV